jgi:hypothetical protein
MRAPCHACLDTPDLWKLRQTKSTGIGQPTERFTCDKSKVMMERAHAGKEGGRMEPLP